MIEILKGHLNSKKHGPGTNPVFFVFFMVEKSWRQRIHGSLLFKVCSKIKVTKQEFCKWNKQWFGNIQSKIKESWSKLEEIQAKDPMPENVKLEASICLEL